MGITLGVVSGKGGVGKTTTVLNIGAALHSMGKSVILVDANLEAADLSLYLGDIDYEHDLMHVLNDEIKMRDAFTIQQHGLKIIPGPLEVVNDIDMSNLKEKIQGLSETHDFVIMDISPGTGKNVRDSIRACDEIILVTVPQLPAVTDVKKVIELATEEQIPIKGVIINAVGRGVNELTGSDIEDFCRAQIIGSIPEDREVCSSVDSLMPLMFMNPKSKAAAKFSQLASSIADIPYEEQAGFVERVRNALRYVVSGKI